MRVLMAMPPGLLDSEHAARPIDRETRWRALRVAGAASGADAAASDAGLPRFLNFADVLVTVHRVALFPELQRLPDDDAVAAARAAARQRLAVLRLAVDRFAVAGARASAAARGAGPAAHPAEADASRLRIVAPDLFDARVRAAVALEVHRSVENDMFRIRSMVDRERV